MGPCGKCGKMFACQLIESASNNEGVHVHMAMVSKHEIHSAIGEAR